MEHFLNANGTVIVLHMIEAIQQNKAYLSDIDGAIGDGDHGINMNKGFSLCKERLNGRSVGFSAALDTLGEILLSEIGGSMGPIYGSFFIEMADSIRDASEIDKEAFRKMLETGLRGIRDIVASDVGDKTLLDCLIPAVSAYSQSVDSGNSFTQSLDAMKAAAEKGRDSTIDLVARVGRASRLGERSRGVLDAGAASCNLIIASMCDAAKLLLA